MSGRNRVRLVKAAFIYVVVVKSFSAVVAKLVVGALYPFACVGCFLAALIEEDF